MKIERATPVGLGRTVLATAIALALSGPVHAVGTQSTTSQFDSAVTYAAYGDQQSSYKLRASDLIGRDVHNAEDDAIGEIDDLVVSRDGDDIMAIVSLGDYFDRGSKLIAIPFEDLRVTQDGEHVYYNVSREDLEGRSEFIYADAQREGETKKRADNTTHNKRDRDGDSLTPFKQSHAKADVEITRAIRKALIDDDTLGTNAKNVKVITVDGRVTLRGSVANADEQARIAAIAESAAAPGGVENQIEVIKR